MKRRLQSYASWLSLALFMFALILCSDLSAQVNEPAADAEPNQPAAAAQAPKKNHRNLFTMIRDGGVMMVPIIGCSFVMLVFAFERFLALRTGRVIPGPFVKRLLLQLEEGTLGRDAAIDLCDKNGSPMAQVFAAGARKWGRSAVEVEQAVLDAGERSANQLRRNLVIFNGVATLTPLLGLLGTVTGMIHSFNTIASSDAMGKPELLAGGIGEALVCTASGLSVAIPALALHFFFVNRIDSLVMRIDSLGEEFVELISADGMARASRTAPKRASAAKAA